MQKQYSVLKTLDELAARLGEEYVRRHNEALAHSVEVLRGPDIPFEGPGPYFMKIQCGGKRD